MALEFLLPEYVKSKLDLIDISLSSLRDAIRGSGNYTLTDLYNIINTHTSKFPSATALADNLSNPTTTIVGAALLGFDGTYFRRVAVDTSSRLRVVAESVANPPNLDVALSSIKSLLPSSLTSSGNFKIAVAEDDVGLAKDSTVSALKNALASVGTDKFRVSVVDTLPRSPFYLTDSSGNELSSYIKNLDTALSSIKSLLPSSLTSSGNFKVAVAEDDVGLLKDSKIPNPLGVITSVDVIGTSTNALAVADLITPARQPYTIQGVSVSTTEGSTSIAAPGAKIVIIKNKGDTDVMIGINGSVPSSNPLVVRARTAKVFVHKGITQINYKVSSGSSTIDIEYYN
jgi:hypothetical protein